jgi:teichoic acid transport system ATP-binding protein
MCSRVVWIDEGELVMDGDPGDVIAVYERFMKDLAAGNNKSALAMRDEARESLVRTVVADLGPSAAQPGGTAA